MFFFLFVCFIVVGKRKRENIITQGNTATGRDSSDVSTIA